MADNCFTIASDYRYDTDPTQVNCYDEDASEFILGKITDYKYNLKSKTDLSSIFSNVFASDMSRIQVTEVPTPAPLPMITEEVEPSPQKKHYINKERVKKMVLHNYVPVNCCAIAVLGLPYSGKSTTLETLFRNTIIHTEKYDVKAEDAPFKLYDVCAFGSYPYEVNTFKWSHTTKRLAPVHFFLSDLTQKSVLRDYTYDFRDSSNGDPVFHDQKLDEHLNFLFTECKKVHASIKEGKIDDMIPRREGLTLVNCFDVGLSKANFDILPLFAYCFKKMFRFTFLSLGSDQDLDCVPNLTTHEKYNNLPERYQIMRNFTKFNYFLRLATGGYDVEVQKDAFKTVVVATHRDQPNPHTVLEDVKSKVSSHPAIDPNWIGVDPSNDSSIKQLQVRIENEIRSNNHVHMTIPLKWIFLRSLISCLTLPDEDSNIPVLMPFSYFSEFGKKLEMNTDEIERFLLTFTDFASLLYCPMYKPLKEYVITDIDAFMKLLDELYHPRPEQDASEYMRKYGIITEAAAKEILKNIAVPFMQILMSLGFAAQLSHDQVEIDRQTTLGCSSYFMPNIRHGYFHNNPPLIDSLLIYFDSSANKCENEASLSKFILTRYAHSKVKLIASEEVNRTQLRIQLDQNTSFELHIIYLGKMFELRLSNLQMTDSQKIIPTLANIVEGCCKCMVGSNFGKGVDFSLKFRCAQQGSSTTYHDIERRHTGTQIECEYCKGSAGKTNRNLWMTAVQKSKVPISFKSSEKNSTKWNYDILDIESIVEIAKQLTTQLLSYEQEDALRDALSLSADELKNDELKEYHGRELFTLMLIMWGKRNAHLINPKRELMDIIKSVGIQIKL